MKPYAETVPNGNATDSHIPDDEVDSIQSGEMNRYLYEILTSGDIKNISVQNLRLLFEDEQTEDPLLTHRHIPLIDIALAGGGDTQNSVEQIEEKLISLGLTGNIDSRKGVREFTLCTKALARLELAAYKNRLLNILEGNENIFELNEEVAEGLEAVKRGVIAKLQELGVSEKYLADFEKKYTPKGEDVGKYYGMIDVGFGRYNIRSVKNISGLTLFMKDFIISIGVNYFQMLEIAQERFFIDTYGDSPTEKFMSGLSESEKEFFVGYIYIHPDNSEVKIEKINRIFFEEQGIQVPQKIFEICRSKNVENPRK